LPISFDSAAKLNKLTAKIANWLKENKRFLKMRVNFVGGLFIVYTASSFLTAFNAMVLFPVVAIILFIFVMSYKSSEEFISLRLVFLGAGTASLISAFVTFIAIAQNGLIQITLDQLAGIFKSLLLASLFSLLERFAKIREDNTKRI